MRVKILLFLMSEMVFLSVCFKIRCKITKNIREKIDKIVQNSKKN